MEAFMCDLVLRVIPTNICVNLLCYFEGNYSTNACIFMFIYTYTTTESNSSTELEISFTQIYLCQSGYREL